ncbi:MAG: DUF393 domain-containing protein [Deltaproteobacteria bacterium]|nr:DUF393 domain-containing protein [Deltaproteobacteria bacterium]
MHFTKPILLYDGACGMCRGGVGWLQKKVPSGAVDFLSTAEEQVSTRFPDLTTGNNSRQMYFINPDGQIFGGARAIAQMLLLSPTFKVFGLFLDFPLVRPFAAVGYRILAFVRQRKSRSCNLHSLFLLCFIFLFSSPLFAQEDSVTVAEEQHKVAPVSFQLESDIFSRYVWYGLASSDGPVWQPSASLSGYNFNFTAWGNFVLDNEPNQGTFNEVDLILGYQNHFQKWGYALSVEGDLFPNGTPKSLDFSTATLKTNIRVTHPAGPVLLFADFVGLFVSVAGGFYGDVGVEWQPKLVKNLSLDTYLLFGGGDEKFNRTHLADEGTRPNLIEYALSLPWTPNEKWTFTPTFHLTHLLLEPVQAARPRQTQVWGGLKTIYIF